MQNASDKSDCEKKDLFTMKRNLFIMKKEPIYHKKRQQKHIMKRDNMSDADNASDCTK